MISNTIISPELTFVKLYSIAALILIVLLVVPISAQEPAAIVDSQSQFIVSDAGLGLAAAIPAEYPAVLRRASVEFLWSR